MSYQINRYNKTLLTVVSDGTINTVTDVTLIGKDFAGFGESLNENFLHILENFAGSVQPPKPVTGQLWFDTVNGKIKFFDGNQWRTSSGTAVSPIQPTGLSKGDFWWDDINNQLYAYSGDSYVLVGPQDSSFGLTQLIYQIVNDADGGTHNVIIAYVDDQPVHIISDDSFVVADDLTGFGYIQEGITLRNTSLPTSPIPGQSNGTARFWGTASDADLLGGVTPPEYVLYTFPTFTVPVTAPSITINEDYFIDTATVNNTTVAQIRNTANDDSVISFFTNDGSGAETETIKISTEGVIPASNNVLDIGSSTKRFANIYATTVNATTFTGTAAQADTLKVGSLYLTGNTGEVADTVMARDSNADVYARRFVGTATQAEYADLAEKYTTDEEYIVGTVMTIGSDENAEMEKAESSNEVTGVISEKPAFLMNASAAGQPVALQGRVPVRVIGPVRKGQTLRTSHNGIASAGPHGSIVGIALQSNFNEAEKLVETFLKI
jgi:hypothetical protein